MTRKQPYFNSSSIPKSPQTLAQLTCAVVQTVIPSIDFSVSIPSAFKNSMLDVIHVDLLQVPGQPITRRKHCQSGWNRDTEVSQCAPIRVKISMSVGNSLLDQRPAGADRHWTFLANAMLGLLCDALAVPGCATTHPVSTCPAQGRKKRRWAAHAKPARH